MEDNYNYPPKKTYNVCRKRGFLESGKLKSNLVLKPKSTQAFEFEFIATVKIISQIVVQ